MVRINGETCDMAGKSITEYLEQAGYNPLRVAMERNGAIVPKAAYGDTFLADGDEVEVVSFVGGG
ncbi:MAG: sulfur carrier protein ThiS [Lachnospiraceae bacterium]|nr:sulfur carrier protein ThiS [Lachnospiraceae bacterium]